MKVLQHVLGFGLIMLGEYLNSRGWFSASVVLVIYAVKVIEYKE